MSHTVNAGIVTAYGAAVRGGYQGTYNEFCEDLVKLTKIINDLTDFEVTVETLAEGASATGTYSDGILSLGIPVGATGNGIDHITLNADYTLTVYFTNGTQWTSGSIRGAKGDTGATPNLTIGTVTTLPAGQDATAEIGGTAEEPVLNFGIPKGSDYGMNVVTLTGTDITLAAQAETRYICGTLASLEITSLPTQGIVDIVFNSGSTATVLDLPSTVQMPEWFLLGANQTVEISILDGVYGSVMTWDSST